MLLVSPSIAFVDIKLGTRVVYFIKGGKLELIAENNNEPSKVLEVKDGHTS